MCTFCPNVRTTEEFNNFMKQNGFGVIYRSSKDVEKFLEETDRTMGQLMKEAGIIK